MVRRAMTEEAMVARALLLGLITMALVLAGALAGDGWFVGLSLAAVAINLASLLRPGPGGRDERTPPPEPLPWFLVAMTHLPETRTPGRSDEPAT